MDALEQRAAHTDQVSWLEYPELHHLVPVFQLHGNKSTAPSFQGVVA